MLGLHALLEKDSKSLDNIELLKARTPNRAELLANKIENGQPMKLVSGLEVVLDPQKNANLVRILRTKDPKAFEATFKKGQKYAPVFIDQEGNAYALNHFAKTPEFGGGAGGAGGGAIVEERSETGQALALGMLNVVRRDLTPSDFDEKNLAAASQLIVPNASEQDVQHVMQLIASDKFWARSFTQVANALNSELSLKGKMYHRKGSAWINDLFITWKVGNQMTDPKAFADVNKWNPSDLWAVAPGVAVPEAGLELSELNEWVLEEMNKKRVYGLSLKKTGPTAQVTFHNIDPKGDQLKMLMRDLIVTKSNDLSNIFMTGDAYMTYEAEKVPLSMYYTLAERDEVKYRSFGGAIQGELLGRKARHGKVGFGTINAVLRSMTGNSITDYKTIRSYVQDPKKKKEVIDELIAMAARVMGRRVTPDMRKQLTKEANNAPVEKVVAKFQAVQLLYHVYTFRQKHKRKADQFLTMLFQYASSQTPLSSAFVKVS